VWLVSVVITRRCAEHSVNIKLLPPPVPYLLTNTLSCDAKLFLVTSRLLCLSVSLLHCVSVCLCVSVCMYVCVSVCLSVCLAPVTVPTDWTRHENVRRTHHQAGFLRTAGGGEAATRRSAQALQGLTEAEPEDLCNTTDRAQQHHDCPRICAISLP